MNKPMEQNRGVRHIATQRYKSTAVEEGIVFEQIIVENLGICRQ